MALPSATITIQRPDGSEILFYDPLPKQDIFHACTAANVLYGGAAGGGKSHGLRYDCYLRCLSRANFHCLLLRRTFPELLHTHIDQMMIEVPMLGGIFAKTENTARFPNGSTIQVGHVEDEQAVINYLSSEYDLICFDELVTFSETQFKRIASRARTKLPGIVPQVRCATNPGGTNSYWVKRYFITKDIQPDEDPVYNPADYAYIPATLDDNKHIDPTYEKRLMALPSEALRQAYRYGNWDMFEGQMFSAWRAISDDNKPWHVIHELPTWEGKPISEIPWIETFRSLDWGYRDPGVCLWFAAMPDGRLIVFKEHVFKETQAKDVARAIKRESVGMKVRYTFADPHCFVKEGAGEGISETFAKNGVTLVRADNERINGWARVHAWLHETTTDASGRKVPMIQFYAPGCPYLVRTLPAQVFDPNNPEDMKTRSVEDHAADALRYGVMSRPSPSRDRPYRTKYVRGTVGWDIQQLLRKSRKGRVRLGEESTRDDASDRTFYRPGESFGD